MCFYFFMNVFEITLVLFTVYSNIFTFFIQWILLLLCNFPVLNLLF